MASPERNRCSNIAPVRRFRSLAWMKARKFPGVRCSTLNTECKSLLCLMTMPGRICVAGIAIRVTPHFLGEPPVGRASHHAATAVHVGSPAKNARLERRTLNFTRGSAGLGNAAVGSASAHDRLAFRIFQTGERYIFCGFLNT